MKEYFWVVCMNAKSGKRLYIKEGKGNSFDWSIKKDDAIWFPDSYSAEKFAKDYFKGFDKWYIAGFDYYI